MAQSPQEIDELALGAAAREGGGNGDDAPWYRLIGRHLVVGDLAHQPEKRLRREYFAVPWWGLAQRDGIYAEGTQGMHRVDELLGDFQVVGFQLATGEQMVESTVDDALPEVMLPETGMMARLPGFDRDCPLEIVNGTIVELPGLCGQAEPYPRCRRRRQRRFTGVEGGQCLGIALGAAEHEDQLVPGIGTLRRMRTDISPGFDRFLAAAELAQQAAAVEQRVAIGGIERQHLLIGDQCVPTSIEPLQAATEAKQRIGAAGADVMHGIEQGGRLAPPFLLHQQSRQSDQRRRIPRRTQERGTIFDLGFALSTGAFEQGGALNQGEWGI